ncbi:alpha-1,3-glucan synthase Ags1 [Pseudozyma hubeiensis SY62]|uniref:Alpha-1,3-glucan synthase Ags1 n=1 Tax=Pseudozyma hubeiensis (strain SY62) TaxID=1305764 RepID=R9P994_PSEHS|nr:alpha-1,3-glucan synthase Ags1 [Pseudozyma hubeiensis SY62]GAC97812.1 alpha-1,3-glucan synthase Ags1 [Pseudozyma hubeiensis SY62]
MADAVDTKKPRDSSRPICRTVDLKVGDECGSRTEQIHRTESLVLIVQKLSQGTTFERSRKSDSDSSCGSCRRCACSKAIFERAKMPVLSKTGAGAEQRPWTDGQRCMFVGQKIADNTKGDCVGAAATANSCRGYLAECKNTIRSPAQVRQRSAGQPPPAILQSKIPMRRTHAKLDSLTVRDTQQCSCMRPETKHLEDGGGMTLPPSQPRSRSLPYPRRAIIATVFHLVNATFRSEQPRNLSGPPSTTCYVSSPHRPFSHRRQEHNGSHIDDYHSSSLHRVTAHHFLRILSAKLVRMKLDHTPFGALREKGRSLRRKGDRTRIQASSTVACDGSLTSPKLSQHRLSHEDLPASSRTSSVEHVGHHNHHLHHHEDFSNNSPVLLRGDKELHDPNFVRHNWEMMSGDSIFPDNQLHIGRSASPRLTSRRSTLSSRTSSRPSSRSGSETGGHHTPTFGLGVGAFSGLSSYAQGGSMGRASGARASSSNRGLQVEGSILRDEEAILDSDDGSSDDDDDDDYQDERYSSHHLQLPSSRRSSPSSGQVSLPPRSPLSSAPVSPLLSHALEQQQAAAFQRRRHWTVAEGSKASNGARLHVMSTQMPRGAAAATLSFSQPA